MKTIKNLFLGLSIIGLSIFAGCSDEDDATLGSIEITIIGLPSGATASVTVAGPGNFSTEVTSDQTIGDLPLGTYQIQVADATVGDDLYVSTESDITVVLVDENPETVAIEYAEFSSVNGIVGTWVSKDENVAPILVNLFTVDSIVATFNMNQTYEVLQYAGGATTPLTLSGTYEQELSSVGNIWTITVNQTSPAALTSEGIFEIDVTANPDAMQYEIVQTQPDIQAVPPTPEAGFGSTNGGAFGTINIQNYVRRAY
jgi:hypothetical protein